VVELAKYRHLRVFKLGKLLYIQKFT